MRKKNYIILRQQVKPKPLTILNQKDLNGQGLHLEENKIYPDLDDSTFSFEIPFYNYFVNFIKISKQAVLRKDYYKLFKQCYKDIYDVELKRESLERYLHAFSNIWRNNSKLGFKIGKFDPSKKGNEKHIASEKNGFSHQRTIKKIQHVNIEDLEFKNQKFLDSF